MERLPDKRQPLLNQLGQIPQLLLFGFDTGCTLASTAFTVLTLAAACFVALAVHEALQSDLASPILHLFSQPLPCPRQSDFGQLVGPPGQQAVGHGAASADCVCALDDAPAEAIGQQSLLFVGVQHSLPASNAVPAPSTNTNAKDIAMEKMYFFKTNSLNNVLRFGIITLRPHNFMAIARG